MNPAKFFVLCFCSLYLGLAMHETWQNSIGSYCWLRMFIQLTNINLAITYRNSCTVYECNGVKDMNGRGP